MVTQPAPARAHDSGFAWLVGRRWFWALVIGTLFSLPLVRALLRPPPKFPPVRGLAPIFTLTRENGKAFGSHDLVNKVWVVSRFTDDDSMLSMRTMHELERHMRKLADEFELVSVVVDPAVDSTARLADWAKVHKTNPRRWALLDGPLPELRRVRGALDLDPSRVSADPLVLVDRRGRIRGIYDITGDPTTDKNAKATLQQIMFDAALLVNGY
ncbi:MAG: SCO family protein [Polyangia bacterium]|jgi:protein SCO1/2